MLCLQESECDHLVRLLKQKYISPYKIIYLIDQKEGDYFKCRNPSTGCCTASQILIPSKEQTKLQKKLTQMIDRHSIKNMLEELFLFCEERYTSIIDKGKSDSLAVTNDVQKYLIDNILAESVNKFIYNKLVIKLAASVNSISTDIGLWATPNTWFNKYPHIQLELFLPQDIATLLNQGFALFIKKLQSLIGSAYQDLILLQKDGKFQQILIQKQQKSLDNETKVLRSPLNYGSLEGEGYFKNLHRLCILLQSIPFELNMKTNSYLTICDNLQVYYYLQSPSQSRRTVKNCKYELVVPVGAAINLIVQKSEIIVRPGDFIIISEQKSYEFKAQDTKFKNGFVIRGFISHAQKK